MKHRIPKDAGFTLVELLTVIGIICILAALSFGIVAGIQKKGDRAAAVSNMRQIGLAMNTFVSDHDGVMPGPIFPGQIPAYSDTKPERLVVLLADYLSIERKNSDDVYIPIFTPPAFKKSDAKNLKAVDARTMVANMKVLKNNALVAPFGSAVPGAESDPLKYVEVISPDVVWALSDADQEHPHVAVAAWKANTASKPYHDDKRVTVFFDGHVDSLDLDQFAIPVVTP